MSREAPVTRSHEVEVRVSHVGHVTVPALPCVPVSALYPLSPLSPFSLSLFLRFGHSLCPFQCHSMSFYFI